MAKTRFGVSLKKMRQVLIGPVAWYIYDLTGSFPSDYQHQKGGTAGTFRGHEYKAWLVKETPYVYVDNQRIRIMAGGQPKSWTKSKIIASAIIQHVEQIEREVAA